MKKALLIILVAIMCIGILPISVFAEESGSQIYTETETESENTESASENEAYEDLLNRLTNFKLETVSDFIFWAVVAIVAIVAVIVVVIVLLIIVIILFVVLGVVLEVIIVPALTALMGPIGAIGGTLVSLVGAIASAIAGAIIMVVEFIIPHLPEMLGLLLLFLSSKQ